MAKKAHGAYWTDEKIKEAIDEWRRKRPEKLKTGDWRVEDVPFYEPGRPPRVDLWQRVDYLDEYDLTYGKKWGASGIGKLREVAVVRPTEQDLHIFEKQDSVFMGRPVQANLEKWQKEHDGLVQAYRDNGVTVHYIEYPKPAIGPLGPIRGQWTGNDAFVVWGGVIVTRVGCWNPLNKGRERVLTEWLVNQGCPVLLTVIGKGTHEAGTILPIADDAIAVGLGTAYNQEGLDQIRPVMQRVGITTIVEAHMAGWIDKLKPPLMSCHHLGEFFAVLDLGKVLMHPTAVDFHFIKWFRDRGFEIVEEDTDEHAEYNPPCLITLEPGKVMMHAGAKETIKRVRRAGVEVVEVPYKENVCMGGGIWCATGKLVRDRGPKLEDMK